MAQAGALPPAAVMQEEAEDVAAAAAELPSEDESEEESEEDDYAPRKKRRAPARSRRAAPAKKSRRSASASPAPQTAPAGRAPQQHADDYISPKVLATAATHLFSLPPAQLTASQRAQCVAQILAKRSRNTEAARRSRERRRGHVEELERRVGELEGENGGLRARVEELERLLGMRG
ncbi:hypothetical protein DFJ74DRAFT_671637 [Hyaloraphidium curvatum]|nr:hypothetical protein DFJ74DRAFT_671637 [Hyaloraphidium curvatum]